MPAFPDLVAPLTDGQVSLRFASEWDIPDILIAFQDDPQLHVSLGMGRPPSGAGRTGRLPPPSETPHAYFPRSPKRHTLGGLFAGDP